MKLNNWVVQDNSLIKDDYTIELIVGAAYVTNNDLEIYEKEFLTLESAIKFCETGECEEEEDNDYF
jgi:hypothetical protein